MKYRFLALLLAIAALLILPSCSGSGMSEDEIRETYRTLVEESYELNNIYYGSGLPYVYDEATMAQLTGIGNGLLRVSYMPVSKESPYQSEAAIREATEKVYSPDLCEHLFTIGFQGLNTGDDETVTFARYIEQSGILTVRMDLAQDAIPMGRTYDFSSMYIIADEGEVIRAEFPSEIGGEKSVNVKITIVKTEDGWRLDSPTY